MGLIILILAGAVGGVIWQVWRRLEWEKAQGRWGGCRPLTGDLLHVKFYGESAKGETYLADYSAEDVRRSQHAYADWGYDPETADEPLTEAEIDLLMPWYRDPTTPTSEASNE